MAGFFHLESPMNEREERGGAIVRRIAAIELSVGAFMAGKAAA